jgi:RNA polymerase sigma-70 factor (ECF subfamily)
MELIEPSSDAALIGRFRQGDREAFTALYRAHHAAVFRFAWHMTGDGAQAAEIAQDVFVWLIHHAAEFDPRRGSLGAFLTGVARKLLLRRRQNQRRWTSLEEVPPPTEDPRQDLSMEAAELRKAISSLPPRYREAVVLCDLEGRTYDEAAAALECATGTVRSRLHRARELLGRKLQWKKEDQRCPI